MLFNHEGIGEHLFDIHAGLDDLFYIGALREYQKEFISTDAGDAVFRVD